MEIEEVKPKQPRLLWIVVVAVVAVAVAVFLVIRTGRMKSKVAQVQPGASSQVERAAGASESGWPTPEPTEPEEPSSYEQTPQPAAREMEVHRVRGEPQPATQPEARAEPVRKPRMEEPRRVMPTEPLQVPTSESGRYVVQVGSYKDERLARVQADKMGQFGYEAWVEPARLPGKGQYYRVRIGGFDRLDDARRVAASMEAILHNQCWVDQR